MAEKTLGDRHEELRLTCGESSFFSDLYVFLHPQKPDEPDDESDDSFRDDTKATYEAVANCIPKVLIADAKAKLDGMKDDPHSPEILRIQKALRVTTEIIENANKTIRPVTIAEQISSVYRGMLLLEQEIATTSWDDSTSGTTVGVRGERSRNALVTHLKELGYTILE